MCDPLRRIGGKSRQRKAQDRGKHGGCSGHGASPIKRLGYEPDIHFTALEMSVVPALLYPRRAE